MHFSKNRSIFDKVVDVIMCSHHIGMHQKIDRVYPKVPRKTKIQSIQRLKLKSNDRIVNPLKLLTEDICPNFEPQKKKIKQRSEFFIKEGRKKELALSLLGFPKQFLVLCLLSSSFKPVLFLSFFFSGKKKCEAHIEIHKHVEIKAVTVSLAATLKTFNISTRSRISPSFHESEARSLRIYSVMSRLVKRFYPRETFRSTHDFGPH